MKDLAKFAGGEMGSLQEFVGKFLEDHQNQIFIDGEHGEIRSGNYMSSFNPYGRPPSGWCIKNEKDPDTGIQAEFTDVKAVRMNAVDMNSRDGVFENMNITGRFDALIKFGGNKMPPPSGQNWEEDIPVPIAGAVIGLATYYSLGGGLYYYPLRKSGNFGFSKESSIGKFIISFGNTLEGRQIAKACIIMGYNSDGGFVRRVVNDGEGNVSIENTNKAGTPSDSSNITIIIF